jgi:hypothetical protein
MSTTTTNEVKTEAGKSGDQQKKSFNKKQQQSTNRSSTKFEGRCDELKGHIYDHGESKYTDQFSNTTKEIISYVGRTYKYGGDISTAIDTLEIPDLEVPERPDDPDDRFEMDIWKTEYIEYRKSKKVLDENVKSLYHLVWGQCSDSMQSKIKSTDDYDEIKRELNGIRLLISIKDASYDYQSSKYRMQSVFEAQYRLLTFHQNTLPVQQYYDTFNNLIQVYEHCGGFVEPSPGCLEYVVGQEGWNANRVTAAQRSSVREMEMAMLFFLHADKNRFGNLIVDTENDYTRGNDTYPKTMTDALNLLVNYKERSDGRVGKGVGVSFTNVGDEKEQKTNKKQKRNKDHITCWHCDKKGHYSNECPNKPEINEATNTTTDAATDTVENSGGESSCCNTVVDCSFHLTVSNKSFQIPSTWILLDNQSTIDVFCNGSLLTDIQRSDRIMNIHCNAGVTEATEMGTLPGYGKVWYHPDGIANILSLSRVRDNGFQVKYNSDRNYFILRKEGMRSDYKFIQSEKGLFYFDTADKR